MCKTQSSTTAIGIAIVRAIESEKPEDERVCYDPYARRLVHPFLFRLVRFFDRLGYSEIRGPGVMGFLVGRERHIDEYLGACLQAGVQQVVILGAGYDARAYRFEQFTQGVIVFEVDHPATQQAKKKKLAKIFGSVPEYVVYAAVDFETQTLGERLLANGYAEGKKTLFIWQGVTQYLTPEGVDGTLEFIASHSGAGSAVIFDYMYTSLLDGTVRHGEVSKMRRDRWMTGEEIRFGIPEDNIGEFLEKRGFILTQNAKCEDLHRAYFTGKRAKRSVADGYAIASAVVNR